MLGKHLWADMIAPLTTTTYSTQFELSSYSTTWNKSSAPTAYCIQHSRM